MANLQNFIFRKRCLSPQIQNLQGNGDNFSWNKGQAVLIAVIFFLIISIIIIFGFVTPILTQAKISSDLTKSRQSFFLAEAGLEDVVYRLKNDYEILETEQVNLGGHTAYVAIEEAPQGKIVISEGDFESRFRKVKVRIIESEGTSFNYGVQVGNGGLQMGNNAEVHGNIFSNGNIVATNNARIFGTAVIAYPNIIDGGRIFLGGDVYAEICNGTRFMDEENIQTLFTNTGTYGGECINHNEVVDWDPISPIDLPISDEDIDGWKEVAFAMGGVCVEPVCDEFGNYTQPIETSGSLGPIKIDGDLTLENGSSLELTGTLWVTGKVTVGNGASVSLSPDVYGDNPPDGPPDSGMIISDNVVLLKNNSNSEGSGTEGSYIMYISTFGPGHAIEVEPGETTATIVYANHGSITINNEVNLLEVVGYEVILQNEAVITYELGLSHTVFTSGPGGSFVLISWKEVE